ncbi:MAG: hypothetical protein QW535_03220 [Candidatus Nezhaarchaeales archaeon]
MARVNLNKVLLVTTIILLLLLLSFIATFTLQGEKYRWRGHHGTTLRGFVHQLGWIGFSLFMISNFYPLLKRVSPRNIKTWLLIHCLSGIASLIFICLHVVGGLWPVGPRDPLSLFAFFLMIMVVVSGVLGRFMRVTFVKSYWRALHVPLTILLYLVLAIHVLDKLTLL